jgi:hypothetical protein
MVAALYLVTNSFPDPEPLKWNIRESGTSLIKHVLFFKGRGAVSDKESSSGVFAELARLLSTLSLAHIADLVSPMNFSLLNSEIEGLANSIESKWRVSNVGTPSPLLEGHFFGIPQSVFSDAKEISEKISTDNSQGTGEQREKSGTVRTLGDLGRLHKNLKDTHKGHTGTSEDVLYEKTLSFTKRTQSVPPKMSFKRLIESRVKQKKDRMQNIVAVLRQQNSATVKDFSNFVKGCGGKTIQRLLIEMVKMGVLKKIGIRRWSHYSLADEKKELSNS